MSLEKLRFEDKFDYRFTIAPGIEHSSLEIPSMLLQPFVENAINHGLAQRRDKGQLNICFWRHNNSVFCVIDDNGVGRGNAQQENSPPKKKHTSSDAIRERLAAYLLADNVEVTVSVTDKTDPYGNSEGTTVQLEIPELI